MPQKRIKIPAGELERTVIRSALNEGQLGVGIWLVKNDTLELSEEITGYPGGYFRTMSDFINEVVYEKDQELARSDLQEYIDDSSHMFRSTFRILTKDKKTKWVLLKGKIERDILTGDQRFNIQFYDVSGTNFLSGNDEETNLLNREFFVSKLVRTINQNRTVKKCAIIGLNVFNIHSIEDVHGYAVRREVIKQVARMLREVTGDYSEIGRFSDDSFGILISDYKGNEMERLTKKIIDTFRVPQLIEGRTIRIEVSMGVALAPDHSEDAMELLLFTEHALSLACQRGKYYTQVFNKKLADKLHERYLIKTELSDAIENGEFYLMYQPQVETSTRNIIGIEVLVRWKNEKLGNVPPNVFIPIAESRGFMVELGQFIIEDSIKTASNWLKMGYEFGTLSINVSPTELSSKAYIDTLLHVCEKYEVPISRIQLEITEGVYMKTIANSLQILQNLIEKGFKISIDDFGTGYSNLSFLPKADLHTIKIDRSLIESMEDKGGQVVVQSIIDLGKNLNYRVLAEGVETEKQLSIITGMGCRYIQGYYFSRPLPEGEMESLLMSGKI